MPTALPVPYNPPLTRWAHGWRTALCVVISGLAWWDIAHSEWQHHVLFFWIDLVCGLVAFVLVFWRRRWPFAIAVVITLLGLVSASAAGPGSLALVSLCTHRRIGQIVTTGVLSVVTGQLFSYIQPTPDGDPPWVNFTFVLAITVALCATGMYVGSRRELVWTLRERARQAEEQQELRLERARALERERIAREMHDVLAHRISLVTMHAGALAYRTDLPPEQVRETAALISTKAHEALADLRVVLGTLRETEPMAPQPTLCELDDLVAEAVESGMRVSLSNTLVDPTAVPDRIGRTVYRIVQEALTNARKHAPGATVAVAVTGAAGEGITLTARNGRKSTVHALPNTGSGLGLVGMRERVELAGGHLYVQDDAGTFALEGWLPWPA